MGAPTWGTNKRNGGSREKKRGESSPGLHRETVAARPQPTSSSRPALETVHFLYFGLSLSPQGHGSGGLLPLKSLSSLAFPPQVEAPMI
eukprot:scaffold73995_cov40-Tisochrysis_lutea.AAC.1